MRKLLIVDPSLQSLEGHSYNYDLAISQAASQFFDEVVTYADRAFRDPSRRLEPCRPVLNRLRIDRLKRFVNAVFYVVRNKSSAGRTAHSTLVPGVWGWGIRLAKWLRARELDASLHAILREHDSADELHILIQHAHLSELRLAARWRGPAQLHLVLRYAPELVNDAHMSAGEFSALLRGMGRTVHLYTDSERLTAQYVAAGAERMVTLPVPILVPPGSSEPLPSDDSTVAVAFLGSSRVEKGYCELPRLIARLPREVNGRSIVAMVQVSDSADPRIRAATESLIELEQRLPAGTLVLLQSPVPLETYYGWVARSGIVALPYLSEKYNASTSGIFVEALGFGVPVVCPAGSWMADIVANAGNEGLRIGEVVQGVEGLPGAVATIAASLPQYRYAVRRFAQEWRRKHNPDLCVSRLLKAAA